MTTEKSSDAKVCMIRTGLPDVEPEQTCEACGTFGTVGRVVISFRGRTEPELHRFCERCWPEECARYEARWKHRSRNALAELFKSESETASEGTSDDNNFDQQPVMVGIGFESATWHAASDHIGKFVELLEMVRGGRIPSETELIEMALEMASEIETNMDSRVGDMPFIVSQFLAEFGSHSDAATASRSSRLPAGSSQTDKIARELAIAEARRASRTTIHDDAKTSLNDNIAAAHASADAVIAEFDKALESLTAPATLESRVVIEKELVEMLQQLEQEIATEASALEAWQSELELATKSGDAYTAAKLSRQGENRMLRLHGLRSTIADVEELHVRLLGKVQ